MITLSRHIRSHATTSVLVPSLETGIMTFASSEDFKVGDWVWYLCPQKYQAKSAKWQRMYVGPYLVIRYTEPVNFVLQKSAKSKPFVTHADKLKKCYGETTVSWLPTANWHNSLKIRVIFVCVKLTHNSTVFWNRVVWMTLDHDNEEFCTDK